MCPFMGLGNHRRSQLDGLHRESEEQRTVTHLCEKWTKKDVEAV